MTDEFKRIDFFSEDNYWRACILQSGIKKYKIDLYDKYGWLRHTVPIDTSASSDVPIEDFLNICNNNLINFNILTLMSIGQKIKEIVKN